MLFGKKHFALVLFTGLLVIVVASYALPTARAMWQRTRSATTTAVTAVPGKVLRFNGATATKAAALVSPPTLGNYAAASITAGGNTTIAPDAIPGDTTSTMASAPGFGGVLSVNPTTGVVSVNNAQPAGTYTVTVQAFGSGGSATKTFTLTVNNPATCTTTNFSGTTEVSVGSNSISVAVGDFNGDGKQDFAAANAGNNTVSIRLGDGAGGFSGTTEVSVGAQPVGVAVGDFNGDGKQDFAAANYGGTTVSIRLGDGAGGFSGTTEVSVGTQPVGVAVGDFNGDGKQDFAAANAGNNTVSIRLGDGAGNFSGTTNISVGALPYLLAVGDFNGDGKQDFAVANFGGNTVSIRLGDGAGGFSGTTNISVGINPFNVAVGDFNGDGKQDLAVANYGGTTVSIRLGDGAGGFSGTTEVSVGTRPVGVAVGDFNGDGKQDFAAANANSNTVSIRLGDGAGGFSGTTNVSVGPRPYVVALGDFNGDGKQDFATANYGGTTVSIRLNSCTSNTTPTITAGSALARIQGSAASNATVATVSDTETAAGALTVAATTVPTGITVSNIVNTNGTITADVAVGCTAAVGANTVVLTVTDGGSLTATANLTVNVASSAASITTPPTTQTVTAGQSVTFSVTAANATGYQWRKGGNPINGATSSSYTINPVSSGDAGSYDVVVTGVCGNATSNAAPLTVNLPPPTLGDYTNASVTVGNNTTITPNAAPTNATSTTASAPGFGGVLRVNPTTGVVSVNNAQPAGTYTVTVKAFGSSGSVTKTFTLAVQNPFACTTTSFSSATEVAAGSRPISMALGDFNGDGKLDFATANSNSNNVSIRLGDSAGSFSGTTEVTVGPTPRSIAAGDFNGDGNLDFAVANEGNDTISIRLGDGAGGFTGTTEVSVGRLPYSVAVGDFNGDGKLDFASINHNNNNVSIRLGDGAGNFSGTTNVSVGSSPYNITVGDFNKDGNLDFATANFFGDTVSIRLGDGAGNFSGTTNVSVGTNPFSVAVGDFNNDGNLDFAAANVNGDTVSIRLGDGAGNFSGTTNVSVGDAPYTVVVGDFNGDGKLDLATANNGSNDASILLGDGAGNFSRLPEVSVGNNPLTIALGDFNGDGKQDFAAPTQSFDKVAIWLNSCTNNTAPAITAAGALARIAGASGSNATVATVSDTETAVGSLTVTATTVPTGLTVTNLTNTNGTITADVAANCTAALGANTVVLTVTDGGGLTATANLTVNVASGAASITTPPATQTATSGGSVTFSVTAANATGYQWRKGGNPINGATSSSYTINPVSSGDAGSYDVVVTGVCGNATSNAATLTVNKASQTITFGTLAAKTWGDAAFAVGATASSNLPVSYSLISGPAMLNGNTVTLTGTGTVTILASQAGNSEYLAASDVEQSFTVNKATLTVTAASKTKVYGQANPTLTYSYSGWVNGDTEASVTGAPRLATNASNSSHVGDYDITVLPNTLSAANYVLNFVSGKLTVTPAPLTVTAESYSRAYGTENPAFTASFNGLVNGDTMNLTAGTATLTTSALPNSPVGSYAIVPSGINNPDYTVTYVPGTLTITSVPAALRVNASLTPSALGQSVTFTVNAQATTPYGGVPSGPLVFLVDGKNPKPFVLNATGQASLTLSTLEIGTHTILASYSGDNNYQTGTKEFTQEVTKAASWTTLTTLANPASVGQRVTLTAKVRSSASQPQGEVEFWAGTQSLGKAPLTNGVASLTNSDLPEGTHVLKAVYLGNEVCSRSTSNELTQQVTTGCTFTLPQKEFMVGPAGGSVNVILESKASCFWTVGLPPSWIEVWSPDIVNGQWVTKLIVAPNAGANVRVAKITFAGQEVTITQSRPMSSVHAASYADQSMAGNSIASIFGTGLAGQTEAASSQPLPKQLANVRVKVRDSQGKEEWADLLFVSEGQINYVVPGGMAEGELVVTVVRDEVEVSASKHLLESVSPGIFSADSSGQGPAAAQIQRVHPDGAQSFAATAQYNATTKSFDYLPITLNTSTSLVADETYLVLFGTGWRNRTSLQSVRAVVGGQDAQVVYAGEQPSYAGLDQVNILLPQSLAGAGVVDVILYVDGKPSNTVKIHVQ